MRLTSRINLISLLCCIGFLVASDFIIECRSHEVDLCSSLIAGTYIPNTPHFRSKFDCGHCFHPPTDIGELSEELNVNISELHKVLQEDAALIIDVRTDFEVRAGHIPAERWTNIPFDYIGAAFKLNKKEFESVYGLPMPDKEDRIIFHCKGGKRSKMALQTAIQLGFKKAQHYPGGWLGWEEDMLCGGH